MDLGIKGPTLTSFLKKPKKEEGNLMGSSFPSWLRRKFKPPT